MNQHKRSIITIDGTSGSGKGSLASSLASKLNWVHLDSGAIYRTFAYYLTQRNALEKSEEEKAQMALEMDFRSCVTNKGEVQLFLDGLLLGSKIRSESISSLSSQVANLPKVRQAFLALQRRYGEPDGLVADGRDMGSVVFPNADCKIFLECSLKLRAERRQKQLQSSGECVSFDEVMSSIKERDERDEMRAIAPLVRPKDAYILDNTGSLEMLVEKALALITPLIR